MDAGDGEVQRDLLVGLERQVGQVELVAVDPVPVLLVARQALGEDGDALVPEEPLVPLEGLTAGRVLGRVPRDVVRDGVERERAAGVSSRTRTRSVTRSSRSNLSSWGRGGRGGGGHRHEPKTLAGTSVT